MKRVGLKCLKWLYDIIKKWVGDNYQPKGEYVTTTSFNSISTQLSGLQTTLNEVKNKLDAYPVMVAADGATYGIKNKAFEKIADSGQAVLTDPLAETLQMKEQVPVMLKDEDEETDETVEEKGEQIFS